MAALAAAAALAGAAATIAVGWACCAAQQAAAALPASAGGAVMTRACPAAAGRLAAAVPAWLALLLLVAGTGRAWVPAPVAQLVAAQVQVADRLTAAVAGILAATQCPARWAGCAAWGQQLVRALVRMVMTTTRQ